MISSVRRLHVRGVFAFLLLTAAPCVTVGCARVTVELNAYRSSDHPWPPPAPENTVYVAAESNSGEALLELELADKARWLLWRAGYRSAPESEARYVLACRASIDDRAIGSQTIVHEEPYFTHVYYHGPCGYRYRSAWYLGPSYSYTYVYPLYTRELIVTLYDRERLAQCEPQKTEPAIVWQAAARSRGRSADLRWQANYLALAVFDHFGRDTGRTIRVNFDPDEARVRSLAHLGRARDGDRPQDADD